MLLREFGFSGFSQIQTLHPAVVHFPVALVPAALVLYGLGQFIEKPGLRLGGKLCLFMGAGSAMLSVLTGGLALGGLPRVGDARRLLDAHLLAAGLFMLVTLLLAGWSMAHAAHRPKRPRLFLAALALDCLLVLQTADLGARLVYLKGAGVQAPPASSAPR
jgi:uncharacterized membrane protein